MAGKEPVMAPANLLVTDCGLYWDRMMEMGRNGYLQWALRSMWDCTEGIRQKTVLALAPRLWLRGWNGKSPCPNTQNARRRPHLMEV